MYKLLIFYLCSMSIFSFSNKEIITWNPENKLSWKDFKAVPIQKENLVALTASGITFEYKIKKTDDIVVSFSTKVSSHFYPDKSWCNKDKVDDYILSHEQLHFDITEIFARKLRQRIEALKPSESIKKELNKAYAVNNKALHKLQMEYDHETRHSINRKAQVKWGVYIKAELKKLEGHSQSKKTTVLKENL